MYWEWTRRPTVGERKLKTARETAKLLKKGQKLSPVILEGRTIAATFWGKAWCENLERYSDYANRLPRGRSYVRNGSVYDLQVTPGKVLARVMGSQAYTIAVSVKAVPAKRWEAICRDCAGGIDSLVELLQGRFSQAVMERICREKEGLFPAPSEIELDCSCPDWAEMCKHVAAVLYGIGARLDTQPELLFRLRQVDEKDLIAAAGSATPLAAAGPARGKVLKGSDLGAVFGIELAAGEVAAQAKKTRGAGKGVVAKKRAPRKNAGRGKARREV